MKLRLLLATAITLNAIAALGSMAFAAEAPDPTASPACREALAQLDRQEAAATRDGAASAVREPVRQARREAAAACLRGPADGPPPNTVRPPVSVTVPEVLRPPATPGVPTAPPASTAPRAPSPSMPTTLSTCDALGCWTSDGTRLQRAGPGLIGPRGPCTPTGTTVGAIVTCP